MTTIQIQNLTSIPAIDDGDVLPIVDVSDGTTYKTTRSNLGRIKVASTSLTSSQIKALQASPVALLSPLGSEKIIQPLGFAMYYTYGTAAYTITGGATLVFTVGIKTAATISQSFLTASVDEYAYAPVVSWTGTKSNFDNTALYIQSSTTPPATGDGTMTVTTWYLVA